MTRRNQKLYADLALCSSKVFRMLTLMDTGAGPNFIGHTELLSERAKYIKHGPLTDICSADFTHGKNGQADRKVSDVPCPC